MQLLFFTLLVSYCFALSKRDEAVHAILNSAHLQIKQSLDDDASSFAKQNGLNGRQFGQVRKAMNPIHDNFMHQFTPLVKEIVSDAARSQSLVKREDPVTPTFFGKVSDKASNMFKSLRQGAMDMTRIVRTRSQPLINFISNIMEKLKEAWKSAMDAIRGTFANVREAITSRFSRRPTEPKEEEAKPSVEETTPTTVSNDAKEGAAEVKTDASAGASSPIEDPEIKPVVPEVPAGKAPGAHEGKAPSAHSQTGIHHEAPSAHEGQGSKAGSKAPSVHAQPHEVPFFKSFKNTLSHPVTKNTALAVFGLGALLALADMYQSNLAPKKNDDFDDSF